MIQISVNGQTRQVPSASSVADLVEQMALTGQRIAIERNGSIVPRSQHAQTRLDDGDCLEIVVAVGGG